MVQIATAGEAAQHADRVVGERPGAYDRFVPFPAGWIGHAAPGTEPSAIVVDRDGTVVRMGDLPDQVIATVYAAGRAVDTITGEQLWPWTAAQAVGRVRALEQLGTVRRLVVQESLPQLWLVQALPKQNCAEVGRPRPTAWVADGRTGEIFAYGHRSHLVSRYLLQRLGGQVSGVRIHPEPRP